MRLSVVTTLYRSAPHLDEFYARMTQAASALTPDYELVFVNDGSPDDSLDVAVALHRSDPRVRVIDLARNFGHHKAMMTGLSHARGDLVFLIDSDLEEEPELLGPFAREMESSSVDVVYGVQAARKGGLFERTTGWLFFWLFNLLSTVPLPVNLVTVRLMTCRYVQSLVAHRERETIIAGLWAITGYTQRGVPIKKGCRSPSTYSITHKLVLLVNSVTSFSDRPLIFIFYLGAAVLAVSLAAAAYLIARRLFFGTLLGGWASVMVSIWVLGGLTLFSLGIVGIYLSKVFVETKGRPYTIVRQVYERESPEAR